MLCLINSATTYGLDGVLIKVEVDVAENGFPTFIIVGLPNKAIEESKDRIRTAIKNSSLDMPETRIVVNLAPADIPKKGSLFDLPIAVGILVSSKTILESPREALFVGELSLDGKIQAVPGILAILLMAKKEGIKTVYIPQENGQEAALVKDIVIYTVSDLQELVLHLNGEILLVEKSFTPILIPEKKYENNFNDIYGQMNAKRALEIAASGFHNIHLKGPPGSGKTLLAKSFPSILPNMKEEEIIEVTKIYSISQGLKNMDIVANRPFRSPHHTTSRVGLIGGGTKLVPGEITLAHRGVLFLDEFPEFPRSVLEALRQPLEDGKIILSRAMGTVLFPSRFILLAASNPCPCGYLGHFKKRCICNMTQILKYKKRVSGPILDRIDLHVNVPPVDNQKLITYSSGESSEVIQKRVEQALEIQLERFKETGIHTNSEMTAQMVKKYCKLHANAEYILKKAVDKMSLSARSYFKIIKVSQTIADLAGDSIIQPDYVSEALQYRVQED